jgi:hypothetical protein
MEEQSIRFEINLELYVFITLSTAINLNENQELYKITGFSLKISKLKHFYALNKITNYIILAFMH